MLQKSVRLALNPILVFPAFLGIALLSGCGSDDGSPKPMVLTEENKANIASERAGDDQQPKANKSGSRQP